MQKLLMVLAAVVVVAGTGWAWSNYNTKIERAVDRSPDIAAPSVEAQPVVSLWVGDSFTGGTGAANPRQGEACLAAQRLDWVCNLDAQGGTGFIADGRANSADFEPLIGRLPETADRYLADVVIIDAGRNDGGLPLDEVTEAMDTYVAAVADAYPKATIVQIVPYQMDQGAAAYEGALANHIKALMAAYDGYVIDPVGEGWVSEEKTADLTTKDGVHPSPAGHEYLADRLARELADLDLN